MDSLGVKILLGAIAVSSIVQVLVLLAVAIGGMQLMRRVQALQGRVEREIEPVLASLSAMSRNVAEASDVAVLQVRRVEALVDETMERIDEARAQVGRIVRKPRGLIGDVSAVFKGLRRGLAVYQRLGGLQVPERGKARRYGGDEHLFI
ncbi:MAG TPA: hypothetical protein VFO85_19540 [Vicinamibacteria bacterium]|nr:hypothetical protein [Vicinamibacteria bacterium]